MGCAPAQPAVMNRFPGGARKTASAARQALHQRIGHANDVNGDERQQRPAMTRQ